MKNYNSKSIKEYTEHNTHLKVLLYSLAHLEKKIDIENGFFCKINRDKIFL